MPKNVLREEVKELQRKEATVAEVLPESEYRRAHIAGAISLPLGRLAAAASRLRRDVPVVVYCYDYQ